jgi:hypothetical protein
VSGSSGSKQETLSSISMKKEKKRKKPRRKKFDNSVHMAFMLASVYLYYDSCYFQKLF